MATRDRDYELERYLNNHEGTNRYTNMVIATGVAREKEITINWLKNHFLGNVEDGLMTYGEALSCYKTTVCLLISLNIIKC